MSRGRSVSDSSARATITALARVSRRALRWCGLLRKLTLPLPARVRDETRSMTMSPSPTSSAPRWSASSRKRTPAASAFCIRALGGVGVNARRELLVGKCLDDAVRDVDSRARVDHRILDHEVELLVRRNLQDHLVGTLLHREQLLVLAQV